jgi:hypothetical protein
MHNATSEAFLYPNRTVAARKSIGHQGESNTGYGSTDENCMVSPSFDTSEPTGISLKLLFVPSFSCVYLSYVSYKPMTLFFLIGEW